ncbi:WbuC family cupin fold metalloprotein [uncultured Pseudodesulfovibrio sp.]|uniref:WbuC family cupin fold metalloprotein n=1 Tax=uncultured Pseudodesulfovibrio sp. TaxID=2035858 RepID=UPI0029C60B2C|nr:WbuC family cupin fold metalloprotein [uncultured Pseudodesulfovibrio sp.]
MQGIHPVTPEVYYADETDVVVAGPEVIDFLKAEAARQPRRRCRLCLHDGVENTLHEMLIVHEKHTFVPPHKHLGKSESFHVVEGDMAVLLFDDQGGLERVIRLSAPGGEHAFCYRLGAQKFHSLIPLSDWVVFHEVANGPFNRDDMIFADWAPQEGDQAAGAAFVGSMLQRL